MTTLVDVAAEAAPEPNARARRIRYAGQVAVLGVAFLALILVGGLSIWLVGKSREDAQWVNHSLDVRNSISLMQLSVRRAESAQRGYLLTSDPSYLDIYHQSADRLPQRVADLKAATADNAEQQDHLQRVDALVKAILDQLNQMIALQQQGRQADVIAMIKAPEGRNRLADFVDQTTKMQELEGRLLAERNDRSAATDDWLLGTSLLGALAILVLSGVSVYLIRRSTNRLERARLEVEAANAQLEEKVAERTSDLKEANEELQRFAYIVSHDLRSPLVNIVGFTGELEAIRRDVLEIEGEEIDDRRRQVLDDFDEALGFIKSSIDKMDRLINAILDFSRAGRREFRPERLDLDKLMANLRDAVTHQALEANATIEIGSMPVIESDRIAIEQIFSNLLDNAVKYLQPGRPGDISLTAVERGNFVIFRVRDNGRGIEERDLTRVFELFRRAGVQNTRGEGIGLAHVRALVRRLGGSIRLDSQLGEGSTFTVILPKNWTQ